MKTIFFIVTVLVLAGCSTRNIEREIRAETTKEKNVSDGKSLEVTIHELIDSSKTLSIVQKNELNDIIEINKRSAQRMIEESYKLRAVLVRELLSGKSDQTKINILKKDIKEIELKRLKNTFDAVEKISNIVSAHPDNHIFSEHLIYIERSFR